MAVSISKSGANILAVHSETNPNKMVSSYFTLEVANTQQLEQVLAGLKKVKQVLEVERES